MMHSLLMPRLVDASAREPGLLVELREQRRMLMFDLGELGVLPPRVLLRVSHAFVTHTHMDHFAGFDHLLAMGLGRMERLVLWGGPGFVGQVEHKLRAYTWNVVHRYEVPLALEVHEAHPGGLRRSAVFCSGTRFARVDGPDQHVPHDVLHEEATFRVRARFVDHEMPVLAFAVEEKARLRIAPDRVAALGFTSGRWLAELKHALLGGAPEDTPITVEWRDRSGEHRTVRTVAELSPVVLDRVAGQRIGYVTDLRCTPANIEQLQALLADVDLLFIESVFAHADREQAARKNHLTARQAGEIARTVRARALVPFHFSPRYQGRYEALVDEARSAWAGAADHAPAFEA